MSFSEVAARFHDAWAAAQPDPGIRFLNYGFVDDDAGSTLDWLAPEDRVDRHHFDLIRRLTRGVDLRGRAVAEVSSGRGGNCWYLSRYAGAGRVVGIDRCRASLALARRGIDTPGVGFVVGDAGRLPLGSGAFDVVVNLEAAHCYDDFSAFLAEVRRVLRPGGFFLFADVWGVSLAGIDWDRRATDLEVWPMERVRSEELGPGVRRALEREGEGVYRSVAGAAGVEGAELGRRIATMARELRTQLATRLVRYPLRVFRKPTGVPEP